MVKDQELVRAVAAIKQRSERQQDLQKLVGAFVDVGIMPQVENTNNQIIYGRRGTGKTHVLRVLGSRLRSERNVVVYIDARTLGSTNQFSDPTVPLPTRCTALFRDILAETHDRLEEHIIENTPEAADQALDRLDEFASVVSQPVTTLLPEKISERSMDRASTGDAFEGGVIASPPKAHITFSSRGEHSAETEGSVTFGTRNEDKIVFPAVAGPLKKALAMCEYQLYLLIDEWSSLPTPVQPYLAEFLKRAFFALSRVTVKIATLEYRSVFSERTPQGQVGFELGADLSAGIDIDDYYVFDRNPDAITDAFGDMLVKHLSNELPPGYMEGELSISGGREFASKLFTERAVFQELVRASEGVARDLINIFHVAYFNAHRKDRDKIERAAVLEGARQWFEQDKQANLDDDLRQVLRRITDEVIGKRRARSFLLPRELEKHPAIQKLFDLRVVHLVRRGYADKDRPGVRYNIYTLDYGTYVDLMNTSKRPDLDVVAREGEAGDDLVVPFDDKRSIRRIILGETVLSNPSDTPGN